MEVEELHPDKQENGVQPVETNTQHSTLLEK
jgi:hypothetical protein